MNVRRAEAAAFPVPRRAGPGRGESGAAASALGAARGGRLRRALLPPSAPPGPAGPRGPASSRRGPQHPRRRSPGRGAGPAARVGMCARRGAGAEWAGPGGRRRREEEGCTRLGLRWRRRPLQLQQPASLARLPLPASGVAFSPALPEGRWRAGRSCGPRIGSLVWDLGIIFRKREKRMSGKGALRRRWKGWEGSLGKGGSGATDW